MEWMNAEGFLVTDDRTRMDIDRIHRWMSGESYWAVGRDRVTVVRSIDNSVTLGCFAPDRRQVGLCRWVTDSATFAWLCDVFVDEGYRGQGLGVFLVGSAMEHPAVAGLRMLLGTRDAHSLYHRFGFTPVALPDRLLEIWEGPPRDG